MGLGIDLFCCFLLCAFFILVEPLDIEVDLDFDLNVNEKCNIFEGSWVYDQTYPMYDSLTCPHIRKEFDCVKYGRKDRDYLKYRWQPATCNVPRFDGEDFLIRNKGKKIMFIGDSISLNQWQSLLCLLHSSVPQSPITQATNGSITTVTYQDYEVSIMFSLSHYLVDIEVTKVGRVLNLNSLKDGVIWNQMDVLIFNTWLWWYRSGVGQPWDFIQYDGKIMKNMDRMAAFQKALTTWGQWVDFSVDQTRTKIFFQGISPSHYVGKDWNEAGVTNCGKETEPVKGSLYPAGMPLASTVLERAIHSVKKKDAIYLLNITTLSQLRKDGHPFSHNAFNGSDCTHWCVAGVLDTWNQLLNVALLSE